MREGEKIRADQKQRRANSLTGRWMNKGKRLEGSKWTRNPERDNKGATARRNSEDSVQWIEQSFTCANLRQLYKLI